MSPLLRCSVCWLGCLSKYRTRAAGGGGEGLNSTTAKRSQAANGEKRTNRAQVFEHEYSLCVLHSADAPGNVRKYEMKVHALWNAYDIRSSKRSGMPSRSLNISLVDLRCDVVCEMKFSRRSFSLSASPSMRSSFPEASSASTSKAFHSLKELFTLSAK